MRISPGNQIFDLTIRDETAVGHVPFLRKNLLLAHSQLKSPLKELSLALVSPRTMAAVHKRYMNKFGATDVLTFELEHDRNHQVTGGEVILCPAVAAAAARAFGVPLRHELLLYALHGMLHLCGFDDKTPSDFKIMHTKEDQILAHLGIGPVFRTRNSPRTTQSHSPVRVPLFPLPVLRERVRVSAERKIAHDKPSPQRSPGVPGEGEVGNTVTQRKHRQKPVRKGR